MEIENMRKRGALVFASCKDINGKIEYIAADDENDIEVYCENGILGHEKELLHWYTNPTPIMVSHHFVWVGQGNRPPQMRISIPFYNEKADPKTGIRGHRIIKEKW